MPYRTTDCTIVVSVIVPAYELHNQRNHTMAESAPTPAAVLWGSLEEVLESHGLKAVRDDRVGIAILTQRSVACGGLLLREAPILSICASTARGHALYQLFAEAVQGQGLDASCASAFHTLCEADGEQRARIAALYRPDPSTSSTTGEYRQRLLAVADLVLADYRAYARYGAWATSELLADLMLTLRMNQHGEQLFELASRFTHSCDPNAACCYSYEETANAGPKQRVVEYVAIRSIAAGEMLTFSYEGTSGAFMLWPGEVRQRRCAILGFVCACRRCQARCDAMRTVRCVQCGACTMQPSLASITVKGGSCGRHRSRPVWHCTACVLEIHPQATQVSTHQSGLAAALVGVELAAAEAEEVVLSVCGHDPLTLEARATHETADLYALGMHCLSTLGWRHWTCGAVMAVLLRRICDGLRCHGLQAMGRELPSRAKALALASTTRAWLSDQMPGTVLEAQLTMLAAQIYAFAGLTKEAIAALAPTLPLLRAVRHRHAGYCERFVLRHHEHKDALGPDPRSHHWYRSSCAGPAFDRDSHSCDDAIDDPFTPPPARIAVPHAPPSLAFSLALAGLAPRFLDMVQEVSGKHRLDGRAAARRRWYSEHTPHATAARTPHGSTAGVAYYNGTFSPSHADVDGTDVDVRTV